MPKKKRGLSKRQQLELSIVAVILLVLGGLAVYISYYGPISGAGFLAGRYRDGDVTGDGIVNRKDVDATLNAVMGRSKFSPAQKRAADLNNDGKLNIVDVVNLLRKTNQDGDLDDDGKITNDDLQVLLRIVAGETTPTDYQKAVGDMNNDGALNVVDATTLAQKLKREGDLDGDGKVTATDYEQLTRFAAGEGTPTEYQKAVGDLTQDGFLNVTDAVQLLQRLQQGGDVDGNGEVTATDVHLILNIVTGTTQASTTQKLVADYNSDGRTTVSDAVALAQKIGVKGDVNGDGRLTSADAELISAITIGSHKPNTWEQAMADDNGDGQVNLLDATAVLRRVQ